MDKRARKELSQKEWDEFVKAWTESESKEQCFVMPDVLCFCLEHGLCKDYLAQYDREERQHNALKGELKKRAWRVHCGYLLAYVNGCYSLLNLTDKRASCASHEFVKRHKLMGMLWGGGDFDREECKVNNIVRNLWLATGLEASSDEEAERIIRAIYAEGVSYDPNAEEVTSDGLFGMEEGRDHTMDCHPEAVHPADFYMARIDYFCHGANRYSPGWRYSEDEAYAVPMGEFRKLLRTWLAGGENVDIEPSFDFTDRFAYVSYYEDRYCPGIARVSSGNSLPLCAPVNQYVRLMQRI